MRFMEMNRLIVPSTIAIWLFAFSAGHALAETEPDSSQSPPDATQPPPASGVIMHMDLETGERVTHRADLEQRFFEEVEEWMQRYHRGPEELEYVEFPDGTVAVNTGRSSINFSVATSGPSGDLRTTCVSGAGGVRSFVTGNRLKSKGGQQ